MKELMKKLKNTKGISLISLSVAISILIIITGTLIYNARDTVDIRKLKNMYNDIELLEDKVETYYMEYGGIPGKIEYNIGNNGMFSAYITRLKDNNEIIAGDTYYVIDLESLDGITSLNYGRDYENKTEEDFPSSSDDDIYIINQESHQIYYVRGIESEGKHYHTNELKTENDINMKITVIDSIEDLVRFEQAVNGGETFDGETVILTRSLDFEDNNSYDGSTVTIGGTSYSLNGTNNLKTYLCEGENGIGWTPIGHYESGSSTNNREFLGNFNGNNFKISNIYVNKTAGYWGQGLFGSSGGTVKNLTVSGEIKGVRLVGGIVGRNSGNIENCINECDVYSNGVADNCSQTGGIVGSNRNDGQIIKCTNMGYIYGDGIQVGGIVGFNSNGNIEECYNTGKVESKLDEVGGITGLNGTSYSSSVKDCYNIGEIKGDTTVGGIVGNHLVSSVIENSYNIGTVTGNSTIGSIIGYKKSTATCTNSYYLVGTASYGIGSTTTDEGAEPKTSEYMKTSDFVELLEGEDEEENWKLGANINNGYPILEWQEGNKVSLEHNELIINSIEDLVRFEQAVNGGNTFEGKTVVLNRNLDFEDSNSYDGTNVTIEGKAYKLNGTNNLKTYLSKDESNPIKSTGWTPIGNYTANTSLAFYGTFDGNGHEISNIYIYRDIKGNSNDARYGLFGNNRGTIKKLGCINSNITVKCESDINNGNVGIISGYNYGNILNCYTDGNAKSEVIGGATSRAGGIVGVNIGTIKDCYNKAVIISKTSNSLSNAGGIAGFGTNISRVESCYNIGKIHAENNTNILNNNINVGGIVGYMQGTISYCYNIGDISAAGSSSVTFIGGICGLFASASVNNCYNIGYIENNSETLHNLLFGMIIGKNDNNGQCTNCKYLKQDSYSAVGNIDINDNSLNNVSSVETIGEMPEILTIINKNGNSNSFKEGIFSMNNGYPILSWQ